MANENKKNELTILYILRVFLSYWLLIGISLLIFLVFGILYYMYASRTYTVYARISINTEQMNANRGSNQYLNVNELMDQEKNFANEITYLRSTPLLKEVINDMNLRVSYYMKEDKIPEEFPFAFYNIYNSSPFIVILNEEHIQPLNVMFYLKILDDEQYTIYAYEPNAYSYSYVNENGSDYSFFFTLGGTYRFGDLIENENCSFKILLNSNYNSAQYQGKDLYFKFNSPQNLAYSFQESLTINSAFFESSIADLSFDSDNLDLGMEFLSNLIEKYIEKNLERKNYNANNTIEYINRQLSNISGSLGQSERQLQAFRTNMDVMNIDEKSRNIYAQQQTLEYNRDEIQTRLQNLTRLKNYFEANKDSSTFIAPSFIGMSDATLATLIQELTTLSNERQQLISTNQLRNPRLRTLDANIATIKNVISENISFNLSAAQNEFEEANRRLNEMSREIAQLPQTQRQLVGLEREFNINDAVYSSLLDKRIQAQIIKASNRPDCEIIEPVRYEEVSSPSLKKVGVISMFLGVFFPSIYIVIINFLSPRIRTKEELMRFTNLSIIDRIPHNDKKQPNVILNYPNSPVAERFHSIRSNIIYYLLGEKNKCILVTSTLPDEGKSFIALNLAYSFASTHYKTVLVSFDLRKYNRFLKEFITDGDQGVSSFLIKKSTIDEITMKTENPNLDIISSGQIPPDPVSLLSLGTTAEFIGELQKKYDYVIIDTPPFGLVTDAFLLMKYADIKLYVSRLGIVTKKPFKQSMEDIESKKIENIYLVQNDVTKIDKTYYQNYSYEDKRIGIFTRVGRVFKKRTK